MRRVERESRRRFGSRPSFGARSRGARGASADHPVRLVSSHVSGAHQGELLSSDSVSLLNDIHKIRAGARRRRLFSFAGQMQEIENAAVVGSVRCGVKGGWGVSLLWRDQPLSAAAFLERHCTASRGMAQEAEDELFCNQPSRESVEGVSLQPIQ
jgi:hypothetical protein